MNPAEVISEVLKSIVEKAQIGVNLLELEQRAETAISIRGAESVNKNYKPDWASTPYPSVVCLGVNDQIGHAIPRDYNLQDGDLLSIDCGIVINGKAGDAGLTISIGKVSNRDERLLRYAKRALYRGIRAIKPGAKITDVGEIIEPYLNRMGFCVVRQMNGHGIGEQMHMEPTIPHFELPRKEKVIKSQPTKGDRSKNKYEYTNQDLGTFQEGQVICIEPHVTYNPNVVKDPDGWTLRTADGRKSAMFEAMVEVTAFGFNVLTTHLDFNDCREDAERREV